MGKLVFALAAIALCTVSLRGVDAADQATRPATAGRRGLPGADSNSPTLSTRSIKA